MIDVEKLKKLHEFATKGDLSTAERHVAEEHIECPVCQGDGEVLASDYCNIDGKALGVQFYGIGNEFGAHEALWSYLVHSVPAILAMAEERDRLRHRLELREPDWPESADGKRIAEALRNCTEVGADPAVLYEAADFIELLPAEAEQEPVAAPCMGMAQNCHWIEGVTTSCSCQCPAPSDQEKRNAEIAAVVLRFIDRMNDVAPECGDPAERIVAEFAAAVQPFLTRARQNGEVG